MGCGTFHELISNHTALKLPSVLLSSRAAWLQRVPGEVEVPDPCHHQTTGVVGGWARGRLAILDTKTSYILGSRPNIVHPDPRPMWRDVNYATLGQSGCLRATPCRASQTPRRMNNLLSASMPRHQKVGINAPLPRYALHRFEAYLKIYYPNSKAQKSRGTIAPNTFNRRRKAFMILLTLQKLLLLLPPGLNSRQI